MDDKQFIQSLQNRFVDVETPESLLPERVAEKLKKTPQVTVVRTVQRMVALAAIFAIVVISSVLTIGPALTGSAGFGSILPSQSDSAPSEDAESQGGVDISNPSNNHQSGLEQVGQQNRPNQSAIDLTRPAIVLAVALVLIVGIVILLLVLPARKAKRQRSLK